MSRAVGFGPGRVNLIGEHTDYNGGLSLPFAIDDGVTVEAESIAGGSEMIARAVDLGEDDRFPLRDPGASEGWRAFVRGVVAELGATVPAARLSIHGTVPRGSGLSSSAALSVGLCMALLGLTGSESGVDRLELAQLCSRVENDWVGAQTGLLDQIASLFGSSGQALRIDFRTLDVEPVELRLGDWRLVLVDSGETHSHASGGYNERRRECAEAASLLGVELLSEAERAAVLELPEPLRSRALHVLDENARVEAAVAALRSDDLPGLGRLLDESHASLRDLYDASTDAVEATVRGLREDAGAAGARMVGGGFGGHVLALLPPGTAPPAGAREVGPAAGARVLERD